MLRIAIIIGSTREHRLGAQVADWVHQHAAAHAPGGVVFEVVDLATFELPVLNEPVPGVFGQYQHGATRRWAAVIDSFDGFVFVTPEYNHGVPGPLKNALDYLYAEWCNKAAGFVSYGVDGGVRAVEQLRMIMAELQVADVRQQVALSVFTDVDYDGVDLEDLTAIGRFAPDERHREDLSTMLHQVAQWAEALAPVRGRTDLRGVDAAPSLTSTTL